jgi:hypothetical protein
MAAPDTTVVTTAIMAAIEPIALVGSAVLLILVMRWVYGVIRGQIGEGADHDRWEEAFHDEFMMTVCPLCGGHSQETDDPDIESGMYCTECGYDGSDPIEREALTPWDDCAMCGRPMEDSEDGEPGTCSFCGHEEVVY